MVQNWIPLPTALFNVRRVQLQPLPLASHSAVPREEMLSKLQRLRSEFGALDREGGFRFQGLP